MFRFEPISDKFSEAAVCRCSAKYVFLKLRKIHWKTYVPNILKACNLQKEIPVHIISCEFGEVFKNTYI